MNVNEVNSGWNKTWTDPFTFMTPLLYPLQMENPIYYVS